VGLGRTDPGGLECPFQETLLPL